MDRSPFLAKAHNGAKNKDLKF